MKGYTPTRVTQAPPRPATKDYNLELLIFALITIFAPWIWYVFKKDREAKSRFNNLAERSRRLWTGFFTYWYYAIYIYFIHIPYTAPWLRATTHLNFRAAEKFLLPYLKGFKYLTIPIPFTSFDPLISFSVLSALPFVILFLFHRRKKKHKNYLLAQEVLHHTNLILPTTQVNKGAPVVVKIPMSDLNAGTLILGTTNSGKTEVINTVVYQLPRDPKDPILFFDPKHDYHRVFYKSGDIVISLTNSTYSWNVFAEAESEEDFDELSAELFASAKDDFWTNSAQQLFSAILKMIFREGKAQGVQPTNADLVKFINSKESKEIYELLREHEDLRSAAQYVSPTTGGQAGGVVSTLYTKFNQIFVGDFKRSDKPEFSIRGYMQEPNGKALFLLFDITKAETIAPIYRLLVDTAAKYAIQPGSEWHKKYFIIDEMQFLPHLQKYQALVNAGRTYHAAAIAGLQSIAQLNGAYGKNVAEAILSGNKHMILLRSGDRETTNFIRAALGKFQRKQETPITEPTVSGPTITGTFTHVTEESPVSEQDVQTLEPGECFIIMRGKWLRTRLLMFEKSKEYLDNVDRWLEKAKKPKSI